MRWIPIGFIGSPIDFFEEGFWKCDKCNLEIHDIFGGGNF